MPVGSGVLGAVIVSAGGAITKTRTMTRVPVIVCRVASRFVLNRTIMFESPLRRLPGYYTPETGMIFGSLKRYARGGHGHSHPSQSEQQLRCAFATAGARDSNSVQGRAEGFRAMLYDLDIRCERGDLRVSSTRIDIRLQSEAKDLTGCRTFIFRFSPRARERQRTKLYRSSQDELWRAIETCVLPQSPFHFFLVASKPVLRGSLSSLTR